MYWPTTKISSGQRILNILIGSVRLFSSKQKNCFPFLLYPFTVDEPEAASIRTELAELELENNSTQLIFAFGPIHRNDQSNGATLLLKPSYLVKS